MQSAQDLLLAKFAVKTGLVSSGVLQDCFREQQRIRGRGQQATLLQVLVRKRVVTPDALIPINQAIEATSFDCARCRVRYPFTRIADTALACPSCRGPLTIVREDGEMISERLNTGRKPGGTQKISTRADSSGPSGKHKKQLPMEPPISRFGPYEVLGELGRGGMGVVYKARHPQLERIVAIKVLLAGPLASKTQLKRFQREAALAGKLKHPGIVAVHDAGVIDERHYFTMDYVEGVALSDRIKARDLPLRHGIEIARDLARALAHAHQMGVIHRDVKPANVILDAEGRPHLTDFGLAREADADESSRLTREGATVGTPFYMSPEQARGDSKALGPATDIYSLGVVLYEMLVFTPPFKADAQIELTRKILTEPPPPLTEIEPAIEPDMEAIVQKVLEKDPQDRYTTADALADELDRYLRGEPVLVGAQRKAERTRGILRAVLLAVLAAATLGGVGLGIYAIVLKRIAEAEAAARKAKEDETALETARRKDAAQRSLKEAETAFSEADRVPVLTANEAFFEKLRVTIDRASECVKNDPSCARAFLLRGRAYEISHKIEQATQDYSKAVELEPQGATGLEATYRQLRMLFRWRQDGSAKEKFAKLSEGPGPQLWRTIARAARLLLDDPHDGPTIDKALAEIDAAKRLDPSCPEVYHLAAMAYEGDQRTDRLKEALEALNNCLDTERKNARVYSMRGGVRINLGQTEQGEEDLRHALALDPDEIGALIIQAKVQANRGNLTQAGELVKRIMTLDGGKDPDTLGFAIQVYAATGDLHEAEKAATALIELAPDKADGYLALVDAIYKQNPALARETLQKGLMRCTNEKSRDELAQAYCQFLASTSSIDEAVAFARNDLEQKPEDTLRTLRLATSYAIRHGPDDLNEAMRLLDEIRARRPDLIDAWNARFKILMDLGRVQELDDAVAGLMRAMPLDPAAWRIIAVVYGATDRDQQALQAAKKALDLDPTSSESNATVAQMELSLNALSDAQRYAKIALDRDPKNHRALTVMGAAIMKGKGPPEEAGRYFDLALRAHPGDADAGYFLAGMYYQKGNFQAAERVAEETLRHIGGSDPSRLLDVLGVSCARQGNFGKAEWALRKELSIDPTSPANGKTHMTLAEILASAGKKADARAEAEAAMKIDPSCEEQARKLIEDMKK